MSDDQITYRLSGVRNDGKVFSSDFTGYHREWAGDTAFKAEAAKPQVRFVMLTIIYPDGNNVVRSSQYNEATK